MQQILSKNLKLKMQRTSVVRAGRRAFGAYISGNGLTPGRFQHYKHLQVTSDQQHTYATKSRWKSNSFEYTERKNFRKRPAHQKSGKAKRSVIINKNILKLGKHQRWKEILDLYEEESISYDTINYATTISQLARIRELDKEDPTFVRFTEELANLVEEKGVHGVGFREISNIVHAIGRMSLRTKPSKRIMKLVIQPENAKAIVSNGSTQDVANICWSMGRQKGSHFGLFFDEMERRSTWLVVEGGSQAVSITAWACAKLGIQSPKLFSRIESQAEMLVHLGNSQTVANTAWAFATLGLDAPNFFAAIDRHSSWLVEMEGDSQHVANTVWAAAKLQHPVRKFIAKIEKQASWFAQEGKTQEVANIAWATATLGVQMPSFFAELEQQSKRLVDTGSSQEVANIAWACSALGIHSPNLFDEIENSSTRLVQKANPQEIANIAWACVKLDRKCYQFFAEIDKRCVSLVKKGNTQEVANIARAFAWFRIHSPDYFGEIEKRVSRFVKLGKPQELTNTALAYAQLGYCSAEFFGALCENIPRLIKTSSEQGVINICYALSTLELTKKYNKEFRQLWDTAITYDPARLSNEELSQLFHVYVFAHVFGEELSEPSPSLLQAFTRSSTGVKSSKSQKAISALLRRLGFDHEMEISPFLSDTSFDPRDTDVLAIDMACKDKLVAVEFDGPNHFLREVRTGRVLNMPDGPTKAKHRLLEHLGWRVIHIPYYDWMKLRGREAKEEYLNDVINQLVDK